MPREQRQHPKQSGKTVKIRKSQGQRKKTQALTADELYERAQAALAFDNYDAALECMRDALELEPENLEVLDAYGALLAELGSSEQAIQVGRLLFGAPFCSCTTW
jgi:Tfp pilus assembly protein PilF